MKECLGPYFRNPWAKVTPLNDFLLLTDLQADVPEHTPRQKTEKLSTDISTLLAVYSCMGTVQAFLLASQ